MSSAQPPQHTGQPHTGQPYAGQQYTEPQYAEAQYAESQYGGASATAGTDPYARTTGSSAAGGSAEGRRDISDTSVGTLLSDVTRDLSTLMRQELALAQAEIKQEATKTAKAAGALTGAGLAGYFVLLFLSIALWAGLSNVMDAGWAGLIVAVLWGVIAAVLFVVGRGQLRRVHPKPERTVETLGQVPEALRPGHNPNAGPNTGGHR